MAKVLPQASSVWSIPARTSDTVKKGKTHLNGQHTQFSSTVTNVVHCNNHRPIPTMCVFISAVACRPEPTALQIVLSKFQCCAFLLLCSTYSSVKFKTLPDTSCRFIHCLIQALTKINSTLYATKRCYIEMLC